MKCDVFIVFPKVWKDRRGCSSSCLGVLILDLGLAQGVPGKTPIFYATKVSFRVPRRNTELREEKQKFRVVFLCF